MVFMHGDLSWDQLQIMISKSTAADLIKMYYKLDEFFSQQFKSSKRVFSSLQDGPKSKSNFNNAAGTSSFRKRNQPTKKKVASTLSEGMTQIPETESKIKTKKKASQAVIYFCLLLSNIK